MYCVMFEIRLGSADRQRRHQHGGNPTPFLSFGIDETRLPRALTQHARLARVTDRSWRQVRADNQSDPSSWMSGSSTFRLKWRSVTASNVMRALSRLQSSFSSFSCVVNWRKQKTKDPFFQPWNLTSRNNKGWRPCFIPQTTSDTLAKCTIFIW